MEQQWDKAAEGLATLFARLGATDEESRLLTDRLRPRWQQLGQPFEFVPSYQLPPPLTPEQIRAIDDAFRSQVALIVQHFKKEHAQTLVEFAMLEFRLLRAEQRHHTNGPRPLPSTPYDDSGGV